MKLFKLVRFDISKYVWPSLIFASKVATYPGACIINFITALIYSFRNKLEFLGKNTLAYYGNHKLLP